MARRRNPLRQALTAAVSIGGYCFFRLLPLPLGRRAGRLLGRIGLLLPRLHRVGMQNLDLAYGDSLTLAEKRRILRGAAENLGIVLAEFPHLPAIATGDISRLASVSGMERIPSGSGALFIGAHQANWEWAGPLMARHDFGAAEVVRPLDNPLVNALVDRARRASGVHTIVKDDAGAEIVRLLRQQGKVGILVDQSPRHNAVPSTFFGQPCWSTIAPVMIAVRTRVPVFPVSIHRRPDWRYEVELGPPIELERTGDLRRDLVANSQRCQDAIEAIIRAHPEQWLWFHRRWKQRPRLEAEWEARLARDRKRAGAELEEAP